MTSRTGFDDAVRLVPASHDDLVEMAEGGVPAELAHRLEPGSLPPPFVAARSLEHRQRGASWDWCGLFYVVDAASERIVGSCGFKSEPRLGVVEIGYGIAASARGQGRATAAVRLLLDMAQRLDPDAAVLAQVNPQNLASTAVVRRLAFRHAGELVDAEGEALV